MHPFNRRTFMAASAAAILATPARAGEDRRRAVEGGARWGVQFEGEPLALMSIGEAMAATRTPGLSFALIDGGKVAWSGGYGVLETGKPARVGPRTLFQAGSVSKPIASIAALRLRDAGVLDLDRPVESYLGDYRIPRDEGVGDAPVTLRNLLSHTSGVRAGGYDGYEPGKRLPTYDQILRGQPPANSVEVRVVVPPNSEMAYSGAGYTVAQIAMAKAAAKPFDALMEQWLLKPFGMADSTFTFPLPQRLHARTARGYRADGAMVPGGWAVHPEQAAAGMWSTASDLARFACLVRDAYLGKGGPLKRESAAEFLRIVMDDEGLGVIVIGEGETLQFRHAGGTQGYRAFFTLHVASGQGAAYMANSDEGQALGSAVLRGASAAYGWPGFRPTIHKRETLEPAVLKSLVGTYVFGEDGPRVAVAYMDAVNGIELRFPNGDVYPMVPIGPRRFVHVQTGRVIGFEGDGLMQVGEQVGTRVPG